VSGLPKSIKNFTGTKNGNLPGYSIHVEVVGKMLLFDLNLLQFHEPILDCLSNLL